MLLPLDRLRSRTVLSRLLLGGFLAVLLLAIAAPSAVQAAWLRPTLARAGLVRTSPQFVELGFTNPNAVDDFVDRDGTIALDFEVASRLAESTTLVWTVIAKTEGTNREQQLEQGKFALAPGQHRSRQVTTKFDCGTRRTEIAVRIRPAAGSTFSPQTIHFWLVGERGTTSTLCRTA